MSETRSLAVTTRTVLLAVCLTGWLAAAHAGPLRLTPAARLEGQVESVVSGDTIVLQSGETVRYLGIEAPQPAHDGQPADCFAEEARRANAELVMGKMVRLEYGPNVADRHGRLLAFVYLPDGRCVNTELVRSGHVWIVRGNGESMPRTSVVARQREAVAKRVGLWGACAVDPEPYYIGYRRSFVFHRPGCPYGQRERGFDKKKFETRWQAFSDGFSPCRHCRP